MSVYTEEYLKNKLMEKLEAVYVVSAFGARSPCWRLRDKIIFFNENPYYSRRRLRHCLSNRFVHCRHRLSGKFREKNSEIF